MKIVIALLVGLPLFAQLPANLPSVAVPAPSAACLTAGCILGVNGWQNPPTGVGGGGGGSNILCSDPQAPGPVTSNTAASDQHICLSPGEHTISSLALTGHRITISGSGPATVLKRIAGLDGLVASGNDILIENLTYDGGGTAMGYAIKSTGDRFGCRNVGLKGFGPNMGRGQVFFSKTSGVRWDNCNWLDSPQEHNIVVSTEVGNVSDLIITRSHLSTSGICPGPGQATACTGLAMLGLPGAYIYSFQISTMTWVGQGRAFYILQNATTPRTGSVKGFTAELTGPVSSEVFGVWGCDGITFSDITGTDNNFTMANQPFFAFHDAKGCHLKAYSVKLLNPMTQAFIALDSPNSSLDGCHVYGGGGNLNNTAGRGMIEWGMGAQGSSNSGSSISGCTVDMPQGATNIAIRSALGFGPADTANDFDISGNRVNGTGAGTGIAVHTANGAVFASPYVGGNRLANLAKGVDISPGVTGAVVLRGAERNLTTPVVDLGTGTVIK